MDKQQLYVLGVGSAIFGVGIVGGALLHRFMFSAPPTRLDNFQRVSRIAKLRAQGLGRNHKMIFVVRTDLAMGKGKIAAQCAHAAVMCYQKAMVMDPENLELWEATGCAKICLKTEGDEKALQELQGKAQALKLVFAIVKDGGHTQVAAGTLTVLGIGPAPVAEIDKVTGSLKLL